MRRSFNLLGPRPDVCKSVGHAWIIDGGQHGERSAYDTRQCDRCGARIANRYLSGLDYDLRNHRGRPIDDDHIALRTRIKQLERRAKAR